METIEFKKYLNKDSGKNIGVTTIKNILIKLVGNSWGL